MISENWSGSELLWDCQQIRQIYKEAGFKPLCICPVDLQSYFYILYRVSLVFCLDMF